MSKAILFLASGFEETESVGTVDILRRGGVQVSLVSVLDTYEVTGSHGITIKADEIISAADLENSDALILPGGMPGTLNLAKSKKLCDALIAQYNKGKIVAAICAAPTVLGKLSILTGKNFTCYPGFESQITNAKYTSSPVEVAGNVITGRAPGTVYEFALKILETIESKNAAISVANDLTTAKNLGY